MSTNFSGVTFAQQRVTPIDDAIIRRAILPDGILTGCRLSYSGSTLTMAAGQMVICGRQIRHAASQNWAVVGATSGYARLLLTIDLTRTATKEVFDQVVDTIEYASSLDGFLALEQADINAAGTKDDPISLVEGSNTGTAPKTGSDKYCYFTFTAGSEGTVTITTANTDWRGNYFLNGEQQNTNLINPKYDGSTITCDLAAGDTFLLMISPYKSYMYGGGITVKLTVKDGRVTGLEVVSAPDEGVPPFSFQLRLWCGILSKHFFQMLPVFIIRFITGIQSFLIPLFSFLKILLHAVPQIAAISVRKHRGRKSLFG